MKCCSLLSDLVAGATPERFAAILQTVGIVVSTLPEREPTRFSGSRLAHEHVEGVVVVPSSR